jgi:hypothetical protein
MRTRVASAEIAKFFEGFVEACGSFSGARIATRHCVPGGAARHRVIESFESRADVERFFQAAADA